MWYEAVAQDGARSIGVAVSSNGISGWKRRDRQAVCQHHCAFAVNVGMYAQVT